MNIARDNARKEKKQWYLPTVPCPACGTMAERLVLNDDCSGCHLDLKEKEIRKNARMWGKKYYYAGVKCPECGKQTRQLVSTGKCAECFPDGKLNPGQRRKTNLHEEK